MIIIEYESYKSYQEKTWIIEENLPYKVMKKSPSIHVP